MNWPDDKAERRRALREAAGVLLLLAGIVVAMVGMVQLAGWPLVLAVTGCVGAAGGLAAMSSNRDHRDSDQ